MSHFALYNLAVEGLIDPTMAADTFSENPSLERHLPIASTREVVDSECSCETCPIWVGTEDASIRGVSMGDLLEDPITSETSWRLAMLELPELLLPFLWISWLELPG